MQRELEALEKKYGGLVQGVKIKVRSKHEPTRYNTVHQGGDRMNSQYHNYSHVYAKYMRGFKGTAGRLAEVGILTGSGLAIWCDVFESFEVHGFDIDPSIFRSNEAKLRDLGAFKSNSPRIDQFDQFCDNRDKLLSIGKFDIVIDDGCHMDAAILKTFESFLPSLKDDFVYFVEDNTSVHKKLRKKYPQFNVSSYGQMTVVTPK